MRKQVLNNIVVLILRLVAMISVMTGGGAAKLRFKTYTLSIFLHQMYEFHKKC